MIKEYTLSSLQILDKDTLLADVAKVCGFPDSFNCTWEALGEAFRCLVQTCSPDVVEILWQPNLSVDAETITIFREICQDNDIQTSF